MAHEKLNALIDSWQDEIFATLKRWIAIESLGTQRTAENAPFGDAVRSALDLFLADAAQMGFETLDVDGYCGHAQYGSGEKTLGILGHLDIVPPGEGWTQDPLGGEIVDGKCYGRGTIDDKGPLLGALFAMRAVKEAGIELADAVRVIAGCDEETGMTDMAYYKTKVAPPDYGFSPDAEYPLINIEKGGLNLVLSAPIESRAGEMQIVSMHAGERCNVVPGVAEAVVMCGDIEGLAAKLGEIEASHEGFLLHAEALPDGMAKIAATGVGAHASLPHLGVNAAGMLLVALGELSAPAAVCALAKKIGMEHDGYSLGIAIADELSGALTCNLGILRCDGRTLEITLDIRYPLAADEQTMCGQACMALSGDGIAVMRDGGHVPLHVPADHKVVKGLLEVYHEQTGLPAYAMAIGGGTYSRTMPSTVAFGINFPGDPDPCHMPDEFVYVDKFMLSIKVMAHAIAKLAGKQDAVPA